MYVPFLTTVSTTQIQDNGPVTGGIGAIATATPAATATGSSSGSSSGSNGAVGIRVSASSAITAAFGLAVAMLFVA